jgi:CRP/FNR family transcriptional regulator, nitrogen fixation regulation protein
MQVSMHTAQRPATRMLPPVAEPDTLDLLEQFGSTVRLQREQEVHAEGDAADYCYRVITGCVRTVRLMEDGRRQVGEFLLAGDTFGFDVIDTHDFAAEAVTDTVLRRYPRRMVEALAESRQALSRRLRELALAHLRSTHERLVLLGRKTASERIASFLMEMDRRVAHRTGSVLELPMCRTDIADHLGLTVETVCRVLAHMKRERIVGITRTGIELHDRVALRALACEARH